MIKREIQLLEIIAELRKELEEKENEKSISEKVAENFKGIMM